MPENEIEDVVFEVERHHLDPLMVALTCAGYCENCDRPFLSVSIDDGPIHFSMFDVTADGLRQLAFMCCAFANKIEGIEPEEG